MDGIIVVNKEKDWTSFDVTKKLRAILHEKKIGHTGTLDPAASGVLVVCAGRATKLVDSITGTDKVYEAEITLGVETDTEDGTGTVLAERPVQVTETEFREAAASFVGEYDQLPPMYSAKKINGKKLYEYARAGREIERRSNKVRIYEIQVSSFTPPTAHLIIRCGKGTYIRTLCADIGRKLGCGACMTALERTRVGKFTIAESRTIAEIQALSDQGRISEVLKPAIYIPEPTVVTFGKFDGGHRGHQLIFENVRKIAAEKGYKTAVLTFTQNPEVVISGKHNPGISTEQEHITRLRNFGFDYVAEFPMNERTMHMQAADFFREVLVNAMNAREIVAGTDCSFGYRAEGNAAFLAKYGAAYGIGVHIIKKKEAVDETGNPREISSTYIKELIASGNVKKARELLGRYFSVSGTVVKGKQIGSTVLGFPTANILPAKGKSLPRTGVYVSRVLIDQKLYKGMTNVGDNPTVAEDNLINIETYVIDYSGDLYGKKIRVDFVERLREQKKFSSLEALREQLQKDVAAAAEYQIMD